MIRPKRFEKINSLILKIRQQKVLLDKDLAELYGVETRRLNEQVKRNCDHLRTLKFSRTMPYGFTEHGAVMLASILNTDRAVKASIFVVRAFVQLRKLLGSHEELTRKINELETKYDAKFSLVFKALKQLIDNSNQPRKQIGFITTKRVMKSRN